MSIADDPKSWGNPQRPVDPFNVPKPQHEDTPYLELLKHYQTLRRVMRDVYTESVNASTRRSLREALRDTPDV